MKPIHFTIIFLFLALVSLACKQSVAVREYQDPQQDLLIGEIAASTLTWMVDIQATPVNTNTIEPIVTAAPSEPSAILQPSKPSPIRTSSPSAAPAQVETQPPLPVPIGSSAINSAGDDSQETYTYITQSGDTLTYIAERFNVSLDKVQPADEIKPEGLLPAGLVLSIPNRTGETSINQTLLPDSEVVYSPSAAGFSAAEYLSNSGGFLSRYSEHVYDGQLSGAEIVERVAVESSLSPRLLLAILEERTGWVLGDQEGQIDTDHPLGLFVPGKVGLYQELTIAATQINKGYYSGRAGVVKDLQFKDQSKLRINPELNAGSMGIQLFYALVTFPGEWESVLYGRDGFKELYEMMFPGISQRAAEVDPLLRENLSQPKLELPFLPGERWSMTGGPHYSWNAFSPRGALDFAPVTGERACEISSAWVTASAAGDVVRSAHNVLALDLDGDQFEGTGWNIIYLHLAEGSMPPAGTQVVLDDRLGHPSCQRGSNTGTHVHIARKFNGEWLPVEDNVPFVLSGWEVYAEEGNYIGGMAKGDEIVEAKPYGPHTSIVVR